MDDEAFVTFINARYTALVRFGVLLTGNLDLAEDLTQSALLRVYPKRQSISHSVEAYVQKTMARAHWRASRSRRPREQSERSLPEQAANDVYARVDDRSALTAALAGLSADQRVVLVLRYWKATPSTVRCSSLSCEADC